MEINDTDSSGIVIVNPNKDSNASDSEESVSDKKDADKSETVSEIKDDGDDKEGETDV